MAGQALNRPPLPTCPAPPLDLRIAGTERGVRKATQNLRAHLSTWNQSQTLIDASELVVCEALNNIVEHALHGLPETRIHVLITLMGNGVVVQICDSGRPMPGGRLPSDRFPSVDVAPDMLPEGGFGWALIQRIARDITYRRSGGCNHLEMHIPEPSDC